MAEIDLQKSEGQQGQISDYARKILIAAGIVFGLALIILFLGAIFRVLMLVLAGVLVCVFFRGIGGWISRKTGMKEGWATFIAILITLAVIAAAVWLLAPSVSKQFNQLSQQIPKSIEKLRSQYGDSQIIKEITKQDISLQSVLTGEGQWLSKITGAVSTVLTVITYIFVILILGFLFSSNPGTYENGMVSLFPKPRRKRAREVLDTLGKTLWQWEIGMVMSMAVVATMTSTGLYLMGIKLALILGLIAGLLTVIPNFGPLISLIPALLMAVLKGPEYMLYVAMLYVGVQAIESNLITPAIQRRMVSLPMALVIIAQLVLGALTGIAGLILAVPVAAIMIVLVKMLYVQDTLKDYEATVQANEKS